MKAILAIVTLLGLAAATTVYGAQQTGAPPENGDQTTVQERDRSQDRDQVFTQEEHHTAAQDRTRTRTPGSEPSGVPQQDRDTMQRRDRIHTPGTAQPGSRPRTAPNSGSGGSRGGGRRR